MHGKNCIRPHSQAKMDAFTVLFNKPGARTFQKDENLCTPKLFEALQGQMSSTSQQSHKLIYWVFYLENAVISIFAAILAMWIDTLTLF